jgi:hypothetical protein
MVSGAVLLGVLVALWMRRPPSSPDAVSDAWMRDRVVRVGRGWS